MVDVRGDVLRPPHGTTPAAVKANKIQKYYIRPVFLFVDFLECYPNMLASLENKNCCFGFLFFICRPSIFLGVKYFCWEINFYLTNQSFFFSLFFSFISCPDKISKLSSKSINKKFWHNYRIMHLHFIFRCLNALFIHLCATCFQFLHFFVSSNLTMGLKTMIKKSGSKEHTKKF